MKSRITIEVNFDEDNLPIIQIISQHSDDVRDKLITSFLQSLQHTSRWCNILYMGNWSVAGTKEANTNPVHKWHIIPIVPTEKKLQEEIDLMSTYLKTLKLKALEPPIGESMPIK